MAAPTDITVTMADAKRAGYCARGVRQWAEANGIEVRQLIAGIKASELPDDACAARVIAKAEERRRGRR